METNDESADRRALAVTYVLLGCCVNAAVGSLLGLYRMSAMALSVAFLVLLCHTQNINLLHLFWRRVRLMVGHKFDTRFTWGELNVHRPYWDFSIRLTDWHKDSGEVRDMLIVAFLVFSVYIHLPTRIIARFPLQPGVSRMDKDVTFGFYTIDNQIVWRWKQGYYSWDLPFFGLKHFSTEVLSIDGKRTTWIELASDRSVDWRVKQHERETAQCANCQVHPYTYTRRNGEVQHRMATCYIERMTHVRKWFAFLKLRRTSIWVTFNEEIGEEVGSWKGGTTGCGYSIRKNETIEQCLRRMESERKFERGRGRPEKTSTWWTLFTHLFVP